MRWILVKDRIAQFNRIAAVNSQLTWGDVGSMLVGGRPVRNAFLDAKMVFLPARTRLYKFNSYAGLMPDKDGNVTGWWSPYHAYGVDPGWGAKMNMARSLRASVRELGRVTSAITESWNSCEHLVVIGLNVDMYVAYGRFKHQLRHDHAEDGRNGEKHPITERPQGHSGAFKPEGRYSFTPPVRSKPRNINLKPLPPLRLPGGGRQFFVPNLKPEYYRVVQSQSLLHL
jgi:hypothetical protein